MGCAVQRWWWSLLTSHDLKCCCRNHWPKVLSESSIMRHKDTFVDVLNKRSGKHHISCPGAITCLQAPGRTARCVPGAAAGRQPDRRVGRPSRDGHGWPGGTAGSRRRSPHTGEGGGRGEGGPAEAHWECDRHCQTGNTVMSMWLKYWTTVKRNS